MYSTCLYCTRDLGHNDAVEMLPIGRRIAFDATTGRLWVVCRQCEKWNLVPFDTRLETIDACERLFSDAKLRFSTDNIGIARLPEGLELVRIGPAQRPEFAAWRYGDQFGRRRKKAYAQVGGTVILASAFVMVRHTLLPWLTVSGGAIFQSVNWGNLAYQRRRTRVRLTTPDGDAVMMTLPQVRQASIAINAHDEWALTVPVFTSARGGMATSLMSTRLELSGKPALDLLGKLLPRLNIRGGSSGRVREAVGLLEQQPELANLIRARQVIADPVPLGLIFRDAATAVRAAAGRAPAAPPTYVVRGSEGSHTLSQLDPTSRLALEMLAHEDGERAALAGELKLLERRWQEADAVAKIADGLVLES